MEDQPAVIIKDLYKSFTLPHERHSGIKQVIVNIFSKKRGSETQKVLKNISFDIKKGEFFGIVGRNGSGKSTLLKLLAGIYAPDRGLVQINGSLTPFIELGVGFNPELTGRENVFLNGALLGFDHSEMQEMYDDIVEFAELERFMDQKLKNYSSGMQVRLAFSIAIRARSDVLLLDEVLAVGDALFQRKCFDYFKELKRRKQTVIFVSHDANILQEYCDKGILLEKGKIVSQGKISKVVKDYLNILNDQEALQDENSATPAAASRWGTGEVLVQSAQTQTPSGAGRRLFTDDDKEIGLSVTYVAKKPADAPIYGIVITDMTGQRVFQSNTLWTKVATTDVKKGQEATVQWTVPNIFSTGTFKVAPAAANRTGDVIYDWRDDFLVFKVRKTLQGTLSISVAHDVAVINPLKRVKSDKDS